MARWLFPALFLLSCSYQIALAASSELVTENRLLPFTTDGCSSFPDGIPLVNPTKWRHCCVIHDVSYWQGGTAEFRAEADAELHACVARTGETGIADAMYLGVRAGGYERLPTTWRWGYGWTIDRGMRPLDDSERVQVEALLPADPLKEPIIDPGVVPTRRTLTGDYCLDMAVQSIRDQRGADFKILGTKESSRPVSHGTEHTIEVELEGCREPARFQFLLLRPKACVTTMNELAARGRIRLERATMCE